MLGEDFVVEECLVRTFVDDFTDALHSVMAVCHAEDYDAAFRLDFYFQWDEMHLAVFDYEYDGGKGAVTSIDVRIGTHPAMALVGEWEAGLLEHVATAALSADESVAILDQLIDGSDQLIYGIEGRHTRRVSLPEDVVSVVDEFLDRLNPE